MDDTQSSKGKREKNENEIPKKNKKQRNECPVKMSEEFGRKRKGT
jgi:hypothetical protein